MDNDALTLKVIIIFSIIAFVFVAVIYQIDSTKQREKIIKELRNEHYEKTQTEEANK
jgi:hypothetical protein